MGFNKRKGQGKGVPREITTGVKALSSEVVEQKGWPLLEKLKVSNHSPSILAIATSL